MTTTVKVITHDWPVSVQQFPLVDREPVEGAEYAEIDQVPPNSEREFHVHSSVDLLIKELDAPTD